MRILHVEDDPGTMRRYAAVLEELGHSVTSARRCKDATDAMEAAHAEGLEFDGVVLDLVLGPALQVDDDGHIKTPERTEWMVPLIRRVYPRAAIVAVSAHLDSASCLELARKGVISVIKEFAPAAEREMVVELAALLEQQRAAADQRVRATIAALGIPPRQIEVFVAGAEGLGDRKTAAALGISVRTVQTQWRNIREILDVPSRTAAVGVLVQLLARPQ